ncbi:glucose-6-phosphate 1-dehydrogenase-like, partial [Ylistrum balloti]|uniref:glucose-6-phosphate 1-dehydrogenase-like n=1 Tax=Ylistrum balloti TaxID=509963 RepID=UPI002905C176
MVQSHALQMLALTLMEPPTDFTSQSIRNEKQKVLAALRLYEKPEDMLDSVVRAQYEGYLDEEGVPKDSKTETFVALKTYVDNWRWSSMPIFIRSGKALSEKCTELVVYLKEIPHNIFKQTAGIDRISSNKITFRIQPDTFIRLKVQTKVPGNRIELLSTDLNFPYQEQFKNVDFINGYDRILFSAMSNDSSLFLSSGELFAQWKFTDSILEQWHST